jgi:4'-phosphopantetheinyl transferase EntD
LKQIATDLSLPDNCNRRKYLNSYEDVLSLNRFLRDALPARCIGEVRPIKPGDEQLLAAVEAEGLERAVLSVRRASGAGRDIARSLCGKLGVPVAAIPRSPRRYPLWPAGITGSITHDAEFAAAVIAPADRFGGVGIDIEPAVPLTPEIRSLVGQPEEWASLSNFALCDKALFSIKEAVFKAVYPRDGIFLDFNNVTVAFGPRTATISYGGTVHWRILNSPRVLAIAWL